MTTPLQAMGLVHDRDLQSRIKFYVVDKALSVAKELDTVTNHADRLAFSMKVLRGNLDWLDTYTVAIMSQAAVISLADPISVEDATLRAQVQGDGPGVFNAMASANK